MTPAGVTLVTTMACYKGRLVSIVEHCSAMMMRYRFIVRTPVSDLHRALHCSNSD